MTSKPEGVLMIVPPHAESSMPLLGVGQLAGWAGQLGLRFHVLDLNARFRDRLLSGEALGTLAEGKSEVDLGRRVRSLGNGCTPGQYWTTVDACRSRLAASKAVLDDFALEWDGGTSRFRWNDFADQRDFLANRSGRSVWEQLLPDLPDQVRDFAPTVVALSVTFDSQLLETLDLLRTLRGMADEAVFVVGGGLVSSCMRKVGDLQSPIADLADLVYVGDGEFLLTALHDWGCGTVLNRAARSTARARFLSAERLRQQVRATRVPSPVFAAGNLDSYLAPARILPYRVNSKCYWSRCDFCDDRRHRSSLDECHDPDYQIDRIEALASDYGARGLSFLDSALSPATLMTLAHGLLDRRLDLAWTANVRLEPGLLAPDLLPTVFSAGCRLLRFGLESASQHVLDTMRKGVRVEVAATIFERCRSVGLPTHAYLIVGHPSEAEPDRQATREFVLAPRTHPDSISVSTCLCYPESGLERRMRPIRTASGCWPVAVEVASLGAFDSFVAGLQKDFARYYHPSRALVSHAHTLALAHVTAGWTDGVPGGG